jgi:hypothetical protein
MNPLKIVIISYHVCPLIGPRSNRTTELSKELARKGHNVTLYALLGKYDYSEIKKETGLVVKNLGKLSWGLTDSDGRTKTSLFTKIMIKYLSKYTAFPKIMLMPMIKKALKKEIDIDILISIAAPHSIHWAIYFSDLHNVKCWIADCGDPFMGNPINSYPFYFKWIEKRWCKKTDFITVPIEEAKAGYYEEFRNKIRLIPQGFDFSTVVLCEYQQNSMPTFAYSGNLYKNGRNIIAFLDYLCTLNIDFKFIVYTKSLSFFQNYTGKLGHKLELRSYQPRDILLKELSKMDFLLNIRNDSTTQLPSKLIDYYLTKRPILEISSSFDEIEYFNEFCNNDYTHKLEEKEISVYEISNVAKQFIDLYCQKFNISK